ncbi:MAG: ATP-grasp domain-containing protein [Longimicrobiales bacterium]
MNRAEQAIAARGAVAIYYEHPDWFRPLFDELDRRGTPYVRLHANEHRYDPSETASPFVVVFNRMSPSAYVRGGGATIFYTTQFLAHLRLFGVRVINGYDAWRVEVSKAYQLSLLERLGLPYPKARIISDAAAAPAAAEGLRYPVVVKPNIGGSGAGIRRFDTPAELERAARGGELDLGIDHTALVQEFIPAESGRIVRVEVLDGRFLYAIRVYTTGDTFNLCPADVCQRVDGLELERLACPADAARNGLRVEGYTPPAEVTTAVERITAASGIEVGGVEYVVDERDGRLYYYDVNALSNFVADAANVVGFDPFACLADWLGDELARAREGRAAPELAGVGIAARDA